MLGGRIIVAISLGTVPTPVGVPVVPLLSMAGAMVRPLFVSDG